MVKVTQRDAHALMDLAGSHQLLQAPGLGTHIELAPCCWLFSAASALGASLMVEQGAAALHLNFCFRAGRWEQKLQRLKQPWLGAAAR